MKISQIVSLNYRVGVGVGETGREVDTGPVLALKRDRDRSSLR